MTDRLHSCVFTSSDGVELVGDRGGSPDAPCVILLHGGGQTRHSWSRAVDSLIDAGLQVINFDARGHGDSDWSPAGAYALSDRAADLRAVLADLRVPFVLVGASLGGATAIQAVHEGLRPAGVVLVDIVPEPDPRGIERIVGFMHGHKDGFASVDDAAAAVAAYNPQRARPSDTSGLMKNLRPRDDGRLYWHWDPRILDTAPTTHHIVVEHATATLGDLVDMPVLLVRGLSSDVVSEAGIGAFRRQVPRLEILDVAGAGHMVAGDRNDAFNDGVIAFAKRLLMPVP
ncbi:MULTISPECIES: alpha/beta fold hydrolase [unclassified Sphingopyxis]|uniref:alpha/beta fold hydrolase n=1 Tax=unclassified Sphingopyxis TaxID=2614943 RepID=UPI00073667BE|nr:MULTISPECIES: alpha/beta hydrolase [unclassified Sphingopyxis]KTE33765.1 alpha/beta hydrolase [Sphingopyxis sp. HIX]KTE83763.1 alpha/beta hydrolase [Sphingopyxis sp. HXXIV]